MRNVLVMLDDVERLAKYKEMGSSLPCRMTFQEYSQEELLADFVVTESNILVLDCKNLEKAKLLLDKNRMSLECVVVLGVDFENDELESIKKISSHDLLLKGLWDISKDFAFNRPMLYNFFSSVRSDYDRSDLLEIGKNLDSIVGKAIQELKRIKKLQEKLVPVRKESIKGITLTSKFAAGESSGGEFFDLIKNSGEFIFLLSSTNSYLTSSMILSQFDALKENSTITKEDLENFVKNLNKEIDSKDISDKKKEVELFLTRIDAKSLAMDILVTGGHKFLCSSGESFLSSSSDNNDPSFQSYKMKRGEKLMLLSTGVNENSGGIVQGLSLNKWAQGLFDKSSREILDEVFFQLKRDLEGQFLTTDASVIVFEVGQNVIVQV